MRRPLGCLFIALSLLASTTVLAQAPYLQKRLNGPGNGLEYIYALDEIGSNLLITSGTRRLSGGPYAMCSVMLSPNGDLISKDELHSDSVGIVNGYRGSSIVVDDSIYLVGGLKWSQDSFLPAITPVGLNGEISTPRLIGDFQQAGFYDAVLADDGSLMLFGSVTNDTGYVDFLLVKADVSGNIQWVKSYGTDTWDQGLSICKGPDGGFFLGGESRAFGSGSTYDIFIIRVDSNGKEIWRGDWGGDDSDWFGNLEYNPEAGLLFTGYMTYEQGVNQGSGAYVMLLNEYGDIIWDQHLSEPYGDTAYYSSFRVGRFLENGRIIVAGKGEVFNIFSSHDKPVAMILDIEGNILMHRIYTSVVKKKSLAWFEDIKELSDGRIIAGGVYVPDTSNAQDTGNQDILIVELDQNGCEYPGCQPPIGVEEVYFSAQETLKAYPNPFNSSIRFEIPPVVGQLSIYSMSGTLIDKLHCSDPDNPFVEYNAPELGRGIYFVTFSSKQLNYQLNARIVKL
ncbi:MAG: T9SS type A sorting domain-containing protein [Flavobacteriales bacterium]|nr:T9SS type A sorting domain-containing protein [Flavobacteriales bacterium]